MVKGYLVDVIRRSNEWATYADLAVKYAKSSQGHDAKSSQGHDLYNF